MKIGVIIGIAVVLVVGYLIATSTMRGPRYRVQVCIFFNNHYNCKTVSARSEQAALRTGVENACADVASGVTEVMNCQSAEPKSIKWLARPNQ